MLSPPSSSQLLYSVRPPLKLKATLPLMPTVPSSCPLWLLTPRHQRGELGEVAAVQLQLRNLFAGNDAGQIGRLGLHLAYL